VRAVLDPNVLISGVLSRSGAPAALLSGWVNGEFDLVVSDLLLEELERALAYPELRPRISAEDAAVLIMLLRDSAIRGHDPADPPARSGDRGDDYLLALAEHERAVLVSGDRHLLALADRFPVRSPRAFLAELQASAPPE
jgi:uncharacterized protein